jgi:hypothetical protein
VKYQLHPEAALEHEEQVAYYEARASGLGGRSKGFLSASYFANLTAPSRFWPLPIIVDVRATGLHGFNTHQPLPMKGHQAFLLAKHADNRRGVAQVLPVYSRSMASMMSALSVCGN